MLHRHRRSAAGLAVLAVATVSWFVMRPATAESSGKARPVHAVQAAIRADGTAIGGDPAWFARKSGAGSYELSFGRDVRLDVQSWNQIATVTARPTATGTWVVDFVADRGPIDTSFTFSAVPVAP